MNNIIEAKLSNSSFIDKLPDFMRWLLILPASIIISLVLSVIYLFLMSLYFDISVGTFDGGFYRLIQSGIIGAAFVFVGAYVAPKYSLVVSIILLVLISVLLTFIYTLSIIGTNESLFYLLLHLVVTILGGGISVAGIFQDIKERT